MTRAKQHKPAAPSRSNPALHLAILRVYASYASHPHACRVHKQAKRILAELEPELFSA